MTLIVVRAEEVREDEPRWWQSDREHAQETINSGSIVVAELHRESREAFGLDDDCKFAIVDRPEAAKPAPIDIKAAREWAERWLSGSPVGEFTFAPLGNVARTILACTPASLGEAIASLPDVAAAVDVCPLRRGADIVVAELNTLLSKHSITGEWTGQELARKGGAGERDLAAACVNAAPVLLAEIDRLRADLASASARLATQAASIEHYQRRTAALVIALGEAVVCAENALERGAATFNADDVKRWRDVLNGTVTP